MTVRAEISGMCVFVNDEGPPVHRRPIWPGEFIGPNQWQDTDISGENDDVKAACAETWTVDALDAYKAANPWVEPVIPVLENISKNLIWERMTDEEADTADVALRGQSPRIYRQYEGATFISTKAPLYPVLLEAMTQLFGAQRAAEILEPDF